MGQHPAPPRKARRLQSLAVSPPVLRCSDLRVDVEGAPAVDGLTFEVTAERALVLGAPGALFEAAAGVRPIARGTLELLGASPADGIRARTHAASACDAPLPPKWSALELASWTARLAGFPKAEARALARASLDRLELKEGLAARPLEGLPPQARRAAQLAAALATAPKLVVLEDPLRGLGDEAARWYARVVLAALEGMPFVVLAPRMSLASPLALAASDVLVVSASRVDARGAPAELAARETGFVLRVHGDAEALRPWLTERGGALELDGARVRVHLGDAMGTRELLAACLEREITVVELLPLSRALA